MSATVTMPVVYYDNTKDQATFGAAGPEPQFLLDSDHFKVVLVGLEPGQQVPVHPEGLAVYHFLSGTGSMTVGRESFPVGPGATVITPAGAVRGVQAATRLVFLGAKPA